MPRVTSRATVRPIWRAMVLELSCSSQDCSPPPLRRREVGRVAGFLPLLLHGLPLLGLLGAG